MGIDISPVREYGSANNFKCPGPRAGKIEARLTRVARSHRSRDPERAKGEAAEVGNGSCSAFRWFVR